MRRVCGSAHRGHAPDSSCISFCDRSCDWMHYSPNHPPAPIASPKAQGPDSGCCRWGQWRCRDRGPSASAEAPTVLKKSLRVGLCLATSAPRSSVWVVRRGGGEGLLSRRPSRAGCVDGGNRYYVPGIRATVDARERGLVPASVGQCPARSVCRKDSPACSRSPSRANVKVRMRMSPIIASNGSGSGVG